MANTKSKEYFHGDTRTPDTSPAGLHVIKLPQCEIGDVVLTERIRQCDGEKKQMNKWMHYFIKLIANIKMRVNHLLKERFSTSPSHPGLQNFPKWAQKEHQDPSRCHPPACSDHQHCRWEDEMCLWDTRLGVCLLEPITTPSNCLHFTYIFLPRVGFAAVFENHKASHIAPMYSLHSWCGMATLVFFCIQVIHSNTHTDQYRSLPAF